MPLPAVPVTSAPAADLDALVAAGWRVEVALDGDVVMVTLSRPVAFTAPSAAEAVARARAYAEV